MTIIKIGNYELDSTKLPKEGLDYSKFDEATQRALSVFDIDKRKGHLSLQELKNAVSFFASQDGAVEHEKRETDEGVTFSTTYHKKDKKLDRYEIQKTEEAYDKKAEKLTKAKKQAIENRTIALMSAYAEKYKEDHQGKMPSDKDLEHLKKIIATNRDLAIMVIGNYNMQDAVAAISRAVEAEKRGFKTTDIGENVFKSNDNKLFTYVNGEFYPADSKGNYTVKEKINDKGQQFSAKYDRNGNLVSVRALNHQNKVYTNPKFASQVLNFEYQENSHGKFACGGRNISESTRIKENWSGYAEYDFVWDDKQHAFVVLEHSNKKITIVGP